MKNQENITPLKDHTNLLGTHAKDMEISNLPNK